MANVPPLRTIATRSAGALLAASLTSAWYYRPIADYSCLNNDEKSVGPDRASQTFCSPSTSPPWSRSHTPLFLCWARGISIGITTLLIRLFMNSYGNYEIVEDECYAHFVETVIGRLESNSQQGLLTVSNHRSLFDDPGVVSCLLPLTMAVRPKYNRWGICSQEYCFSEALPGIVKGYIGAGQVLPICRGGGIDQKLLLDFGRHLACGEWCHVFPEGGVWQWQELGGRRRESDCINDNHGAKNRVIPGTLQQKALPMSPKGKLKWGVGKLIAHAPVTPIVIPFAHVGMEKLLPQDEFTGKTRLRDNLLQSMIPSFFGGKSDDRLCVKIQFGKEITFDDILANHEAMYGKLWKYSGKIDAEEELEKGEPSGNFHKLWDSNAVERELYSKIVKRIEDHLEVLTKEVCSSFDTDSP